MRINNTISKTNTNNAAEEINQKRAKQYELAIALSVCLLILVSVFFAGNYFIFNQQEVEIGNKGKKVSEIQANNNLLQQIADNRYELDKRTNEIQEAYKILAPLVPDRKELPVILDKIQQSAIDRGLRLENFIPKPATNKQGALSEVPITIELLGDDQQIRLYISSLNHLERILHLNSLKTTAVEVEEKKFKVQMEVSAYISNIQNSELATATNK